MEKRAIQFRFSRNSTYGPFKGLKVHDCLPHDILIVKLETNGLNKPSLNLVNDYSCFGKQRT